MTDSKRDDAVPSADELHEIALPAVVRRSPRLARFVATGAFAGILLGVVVSLGLPGAGASYRTVVTILVALGFGVIGGLSAGALATRPARDEHPALAGGLIAGAAGVLLFVVRWPENVSTQWVIVAIGVVAAMAALGAFIGRNFAASRRRELEPWPTPDAPAAKKPAAKKPATKKPAAKKPAAKKSQKKAP